MVSTDESQYELNETQQKKYCMFWETIWMLRGVSLGRQRHMYWMEINITAGEAEKLFL